MFELKFWCLHNGLEKQRRVAGLCYLMAVGIEWFLGLSHRQGVSLSYHAGHDNIHLVRVVFLSSVTSGLILSNISGTNLTNAVFFRLYSAVTIAVAAIFLHSNPNT